MKYCIMYKGEIYQVSRLQWLYYTAHMSETWNLKEHQINDVMIQTSFTGIDKGYGPFETLITGGVYGEIIINHKTRKEALERHMECVRLSREGKYRYTIGREVKRCYSLSSK